MELHLPYVHFMHEDEVVMLHCRCGSASHLGVECSIPTVGVGKTLLQWDGLNERHVRDTIAQALQALKEGQGLPAGCYTHFTPRGESVACMELIGEGSGDVLGVAVAGMHASQRPIYISRGELFVNTYFLHAVVPEGPTCGYLYLSTEIMCPT